MTPLYILSSILSIFILASIYLLYKIKNLNFLISFYKENIFKQDTLINDLTCANNEIIFENIALKEKLKFEQEKFQEFRETQKQLSENNKSALYELGSKLTQDLLTIHKRENDEARKITEQNLKNTTESLFGNLQDILKKISILDNDVNSSRSTIDLIKTSLLSPSGAGSLAEITLENLIRASGLKANIDFLMQYSMSDNKLRPDAVIFLPSGNVMVIDAKASKFLTEINLPENINNPLMVEKLLNTMNLHLKSLNSKDYKENLINSLNQKGYRPSNVIILMFLPSEHAIEKIHEYDRNFMQKAWASEILPVGPAGVVNMLNFAKFQITENLKSENYKIIIDEVKKLVLSFGTLNEHSRKISSSIQSLVNNYDKFAASFNHNLLSKVKNLHKLGVADKKTQEPLERLQIFSSKLDIIDVVASEEEMRLLEEEVE